MKSIMKWIAKGVFLAFAIAVIAYTSYMTFLLADRLVPDNIILQVLTVIFFDGAALVWFLQFMYGAEGVAQWGISLIGWLLGLIGAFAMTAAEIIFSQDLVVVEDTTRYGWIIIIAVAVACLLNVFFAYTYHIVAPKSWREISSAVELAKMEDRAFTNAMSETSRRLDEVVGPLTETFLDMLNEGVQAKSLYFRRQGKLTPAAEPGPQPGVVDVKARDVEPEPEKESLIDKIKMAVGPKHRRKPVQPASQAQVYSAETHAPACPICGLTIGPGLDVIRVKDGKLVHKDCLNPPTPQEAVASPKNA